MPTKMISMSILKKQSKDFFQFSFNKEVAMTSNKKESFVYNQSNTSSHDF